jgi:hypothetical protein
MQRPTGVTVLAVLFFIGAGFLALAGLGLLVGGALFGAVGGGGDASGAMAMLGALGAIGGVVILVFAALHAFVGWGLIKLKKWAWIVSLVLMVLGVLQALLGVVSGDFFMSPLILAIDGFFAYYLLKPEVKQVFA